MKNITLGFLVILFISFCVFAQNNTTNYQLIGEWINHWDTPKSKTGKRYQNDSTSLKKIHGQHLIFKEDGTFIDVYFAPCGTDGDIHKYIGKWKLKKNKINIYDLEEEYNKAHHYSIFPDSSDMILNEMGTFKIITLKDNQLHLEIIDNYEVKSTKKIH